MTDIVGSTELAAKLGDQRWRSLRDRHDTLVRDLLRTFAGREVKHTGDGVLAALPSPSDAVRCARAIQHQLIPHELHVRAGVHLGECEALGDDLGGMAVHIAARTAALAAPDEVLVTTAVRDAMLGSAITFTTRGAYDLKGVPGTWQLHAATQHLTSTAA
jgi:class 3 adenylate cyclase